jgi:hypothetical protein
MNGSEFLVAANMVRDYDWVVLPRSISKSERMGVLQQLPDQVNSSVQTLQITHRGRPLWVALKIEHTIDNAGEAFRDEFGRELRHLYGVTSEAPISPAVAQQLVTRIRPAMITKLNEFLRPASGPRRGNDPDHDRLGLKARLPIDRFGAPAKLPRSLRLSISIIAVLLVAAGVGISGYSLHRTSNIDTALQDFESRLQSLESRLMGADRSSKDAAPQ